MVEFKYEDSKYIHNKNRDAIKNWLLNPPPKHHEMLLEMAGFAPYPGFSFEYAFDQSYYDDEERMGLDCLKDLGLDDNDNNLNTFMYTLQALSRFLTSTKRLKEYKVHLKKIELGGDFNA